MTWLWYKSDICFIFFRDHSGEKFQVYVEKNSSGTGGNGNTKETASVSGHFLLFGRPVLALNGEKRFQGHFTGWEKERFMLAILNIPQMILASRACVFKLAIKDQVKTRMPWILEKVYLVEECYIGLTEIFETFISMRFQMTGKEKSKR